MRWQQRLYWILILACVLGSGCQGAGEEPQQDPSDNAGSLAQDSGSTSDSSAPPTTPPSTAGSGGLPSLGADSAKKEGPALIEALKTGASIWLKVSLSSDDSPQGLLPGAAPTDPLSDTDTAALLARLPPLEIPPDTKKTLALAPSTAPPPPPNQTLGVFPPPDALTPPALDLGDTPLKVERSKPTGDIDTVTDISVTFSRPMVALGTTNATGNTVPALMTPPLAGKWRWAGTQTLIFEPEGKYVPRSTVVTLTVPAGTLDATGQALAEAHTWSFQTPTAKLRQFAPKGDAQPLKPVMYATFDQPIDPDAVLKHLTVTAQDKTFEVALLTPDELKALPTSHQARRATETHPETTLVFRATEPFPFDSEVSVTFGAGLPAKEGPRLTENPQTTTFRTHGPLRFVSARCSYVFNSKEIMCSRPWEALSVSYTNPLADDPDLASPVTIEPPAQDLSVKVSDHYLLIRADWKPATTYKVSIDGALLDVFGNKLEPHDPITFKVPEPPPAKPRKELRPINAQEMHLHPDSPRRAAFLSIGYPEVRVRVMAVLPQHQKAFSSLSSEFGYYSLETPLRHTPPGTLVLEKTLSIPTPDVWTIQTIDLSAVAKGGRFGMFIVIVESAEPPKDHDKDPKTPPINPPGFAQWFTLSDLGISTYQTRGQVLVSAVSLRDGRPIEGVSIHRRSKDWLKDFGEPVSTDSHGLATFSHASLAGNEQFIAQHGDDLTSFVVRVAASDTAGLVWFVFDDRHLYRPDEEIHLKGWIRLRTPGPDGDIEPYGEGLTLHYTLNDAAGTEVSAGSTTVNALGGFDFKAALKPSMTLGNATVRLKLETAENTALAHTSTSHQLEVREFRRPKFEVSASVDDGSIVLGEETRAKASVHYFSGEPLAGASVEWVVSRRPAYFDPPNRGDFSFGGWSIEEGPLALGSLGSGAGNTSIGAPEALSATTGGQGEHVLQIKPQLEAWQGALQGPVVLEPSATVVDLDRQRWSVKTSPILVHPSSVYLGLKKSEEPLLTTTPLHADFAVVDLDGAGVKGHPIAAQLVRLDDVINPKTKLLDVIARDPQDCAQTSTADTARCTFKVETPGRYALRALTSDALGRVSVVQKTYWVREPEVLTPATASPYKGGGAPRIAALTLDRVTYQPGDKAVLKVKSSLRTASGFVFITRDGLVGVEHITVKDKEASLEIPVEEKHFPNLALKVVLFGAKLSLDDNGLPHADALTEWAVLEGDGRIWLEPALRRLQVEVALDKQTRSPGDEAQATITVTDVDGKPAPDAEVAVVVVDEAVLALTNYQIPHPFVTFYQRLRRSGAMQVQEDDLVVLSDKYLEEQHAANQTPSQGGDIKGLSGGGSSPFLSRSEEGLGSMGGGGGGGSIAAAPAIQVRADLRALAFAAPSLRTDAQGKVVVRFKLPDSLTRYRVTAVAAEAKRFGKGEATVEASLPLTMRPSMPRFLNYGDSFALPVVIHNGSDSAQRVRVAARVHNLELTGPAGQQLTIPPGERREVRILAKTQDPGKALIQVAIAGDCADQARCSDAAQLEIPVWTPATAEAFATYGVIDGQGAIQPLSMPTEVYPDFGGLEVTTTSTALAGLTDALIYLVEYPYGCSEQVSSRVLSVAALRDVVGAFNADGLPPEAALWEAVTKDFDLLATRQNDDGGLPYWRRGDDSDPYLTAHAAVALALAESKKLTAATHADLRAGLIRYLRGVDGRIPAYYGIKSANMLRSYGLYALDALGEDIHAQARALLEKELGGENLSMESVGWLLMALADDPASEEVRGKALQHVRDHVTETASTAHFNDSYISATHLVLHSNRRTDAVLLTALIAADPTSSLVPKLLKGLVDARKKGRWNNTQENAFALVAVARYFEAYEAEAPDMVARLWVGEQYGGERIYKGRSAEQHLIEVPMPQVLAGGSVANIVLTREGTGRLYYRLGLRYAPKDLKPPPAEYGFSIARTYEAIDNPDDVTQDPDGTWKVKGGARVRVWLEMSNPTARHHVAVTDRVPAGFDVVDMALKGAQGAPSAAGAQPAYDQAYRGYGGGWWFNHIDLRDERVQLFAGYLSAGTYRYSYVMNATTPGTFIAPAPFVEEMYAPETFGRGTSERVVIEGSATLRGGLKQASLVDVSYLPHFDAK